MKVIIPAAGTGKRLRPHTNTKPKPMVYVAGKPIIGHILDRLSEIDPEELIIVVGYRKDALKKYVTKHYINKFRKITYVEQELQKGLAHAIYLCKDIVQHTPVIISLGDMLFKTDYRDFLEKHKKNCPCSGSIGIKRVDHPQYYGIVELSEKNSRIIRNMVEKPRNPISDLAIAGVYVIEDTMLLFESIEKQMEQSKDRVEYNLTESLQIMVDYGAKLKIFDVHDWYDCGRPETLLEVNKLLLKELYKKKRISNPPKSENSIILQPSAIGDNVYIKNSIIGPYVSVADSTTIENSIITESIIGKDAYIVNMNLRDSLIGDDVELSGKKNSLNIGDNSSVIF